jgi:hypothetical protein
MNRRLTLALTLLALSACSPAAVSTLTSTRAAFCAPAADSALIRLKRAVAAVAEAKKPPPPKVP